MKCGALLESVSDEQMIGKYITLCTRDALIENNIPDTKEEEEKFFDD